MKHLLWHRKSQIYLGIFLLIGITVGIRCTQQQKTTHSAHFVGIQSCQSCHQEIYNDYIETGMGRSLYPPNLNNRIEKFGPDQVVYDESSDFSYYAYWDGENMFIKEYRLQEGDTIFIRVEKVDYVVGSGNQTRSYFIQRKGYLYEVPITWYVEKQIWDLSPGYEGGNNARFGREIGTECLHCHTGQYELVAGSKNKYTHLDMGIDCERCHGAGSEHIRLAESGVGEEAIVHPENLSLEAQFDICQQCHLQGINVLQDGKRFADFHAGMRLNEVYEVFLTPDSSESSFGIASHAARLQESQCFIQSEGQLTCITCHDPHKSLHKFNDNLYIQQCQQCHQDGKSALCDAPMEIQMQAEGDCISCHMPSGGTSDIPHVSFHDHKIRVVERDTINVEEQTDFLKLLCATSEEPSSSSKVQAWLSYLELVDGNPEILEEVAKVIAADNYFGQASLFYYRGNLGEALTSIEQAETLYPDSIPVLLRKGEILEAQGVFEQAYETFKKVYEKQGENIEAGLKVVNNRLKIGEDRLTILQESSKILEELRLKKPFDVRILSNLAFVRLNQQRIPEAEALLVKALNLDPDHATSLENMCYLQLQKNNIQQARRYFTHLKNKHPKNTTIDRLELLMD